MKTSAELFNEFFHDDPVRKEYYKEIFPMDQKTTSAIISFAEFMLQDYLDNLLNPQLIELENRLHIAADIIDAYKKEVK